MRVDWPFAGGEPELRELKELLAEPQRGGAVLVGAAGVGKTRLAEEGLLAAEALGYATARATGTKTARAIPFGAVATLLPSSTQQPVVDDRAETIRRMRALIE